MRLQEFETGCGTHLTADLAGAMLCAILSDTVLFKSPTCTEFDKKAAAELAKIASVADTESLGMDMFKAKSNLDASPRDLIFRLLIRWQQVDCCRSEG